MPVPPLLQVLDRAGVTTDRVVQFCLYIATAVSSGDDQAWNQVVIKVFGFADERNPSFHIDYIEYLIMFKSSLALTIIYFSM